MTSRRTDGGLFSEEGKRILLHKIPLEIVFRYYWIVSLLPLNRSEINERNEAFGINGKTVEMEIYI